MLGRRSGDSVGHPLRFVIEILALASAPLTAACGGGGDAAQPLEVTRVDSAGVEIVTNQAGASAVGTFALLDSVPALRLGSLAGRPEEQFGSVVDIQPLPGGGVAVLDDQAAEVRLFDSSGADLTSWGSKGSGPGELQSPNELALLPGDTLAVFDGRMRRVTRFGPDGTLGRVTTLQLEGPRTAAAVFLPDGGLLGQSIWRSPDPSGASPPGVDAPALVRDTAVLTRFSRDGVLVDTVDVLPGKEFIQRILLGEGTVSVYKRPPVFGRANVFAAHPEGIWSTINDRFELRLFNAGGRLIRLVRVPGLERPATDELARAIREQAFAETETAVQRRDVEMWYGLSPRPETLPAYDRIVVDDHGRLWVHAWSGLDDAATRWWVFEADGALLGAVDALGRMTIMSVRCGRVWGVERDELDVSYVVRYPIQGSDGARMELSSDCARAR